MLVLVTEAAAELVARYPIDDRVFAQPACLTEDWQIRLRHRGRYAQIYILIHDADIFSISTTPWYMMLGNWYTTFIQQHGNHRRADKRKFLQSRGTR